MKAQAVGNAVYLCHASAGDVAAWACESRDRAAFVADKINFALTAAITPMLSALTDAAAALEHHDPDGSTLRRVRAAIRAARGEGE